MLNDSPEATGAEGEVKNLGVCPKPLGRVPAKPRECTGRNKGAVPPVH